MKPTLLTLSLIFIVSMGMAQSKPDTTKYTLYLKVDSAQYVQVKESLQKVYECLDKSDAPHHNVDDSMKFIQMLYAEFERENRVQDKQKQIKK